MITQNNKRTGIEGRILIGFSEQRQTRTSVGLSADNKKQSERIASFHIGDTFSRKTSQACFDPLTTGG